MKLLVTGGAGFIGSNFISYMHQAHPDGRIVCLDKLTYAGNLSNLSAAVGQEWFRFVRGDICDRQTVDVLFEEEKPDAVVNFAAESHVDRSIETPGLFLHTNVLGTQVLMDACLRHGVSRFHQVSTDEVYGDLPLDRADLRFAEGSPLRPSSPYSASKASADLLALSYHRTFGLPITVSRCSNNYGPFQFPEKLIPRMIFLCMEHQSLPVYGSGLHVRDWLHVQDHCRAIDLILFGGKAGEVYNIGGGCEMKNIEIIRLICRGMGKKEICIQHVADRKGHDLRYAVDYSKITQTLGWKPQVPFEAGMESTIRWYRENEAWLRNIVSGQYRIFPE